MELENATLQNEFKSDKSIDIKSITKKGDVNGTRTFYFPTRSIHELQLQLRHTGWFNLSIPHQNTEVISIMLEQIQEVSSQGIVRKSWSDIQNLDKSVTIEDILFNDIPIKKIQQRILLDKQSCFFTIIIFKQQGKYKYGNMEFEVFPGNVKFSIHFDNWVFIEPKLQCKFKIKNNNQNIVDLSGNMLSNNIHTFIQIPDIVLIDDQVKDKCVDQYNNKQNQLSSLVVNFNVLDESKKQGHSLYYDPLIQLIDMGTIYSTNNTNNSISIPLLTIPTKNKNEMVKPINTVWIWVIIIVSITFLILISALYLVIKKKIKKEKNK